MIIDGIVGVIGSILSALITGIMALVPDPPTWAGSALSGAAEVYGYVNSVSAWVPVGLALTVGAAIGATYIFMVVAGIVRMTLSYLTLGGGAT